MAKKLRRSYNLNFVSKENDINKIIRTQKKTGERMSFLFISTWDYHCEQLMHKVGKRYPKVIEGAETLHVVDSFHTPHSFVIYGTTSTPTLVSVNGSDVQKESYTPNIWHKLGL